MEPYKIDTRVKKAMNQRLYLIGIETNKTLNSEHVKIYKIVGSTGNIYTVTINEIASCTCLDFLTHHCRCKHIYFVLLRVIRIDPIYKDKEIFTIEELVIMSNETKHVEGLYIANIFINKYNDLMGLNDDDMNLIKMVEAKLEDACPICMDDILNDEEYIVCEKSCGKCVHKNCFTVWTANHPPNCLYCKKPIIKQIVNYINIYDN